MDEMNVPIFAKAYDLYKLLSSFRSTVPKHDRHGLWQRTEEQCLLVIESLFLAGQVNRNPKSVALEHASVQLNMLRIFIRLAKNTKAIDLKKYAQAQQIIDEIGRMLGGWIRATKTSDKSPPPTGFVKEKRRKCRAESNPMFSLASAFQLLKFNWSPFQFTLSQLPSAVRTVPNSICRHCG